MHPHSYNFIYIFRVLKCARLSALILLQLLFAHIRCVYLVATPLAESFFPLPSFSIPSSKCPFYQHLLQLQLRIPRTVPRQLTSLSPSCVRPGNYSNNCPFQEVIIFGRINISFRLKFIMVNHQASSLTLAKVRKIIALISLS